MRPKGEECQCAACGLVFTGLKPFDRHRQEGRCLPPDQVLKRNGERALFGHLRVGGRIVWSTARP